MTSVSRSFAIVPAAGLSLRMGEPKLLLPWRGRTLLGHVLRMWQQSRVDEIVVITRGDDEPLREIAKHAGVHAPVPAEDPHDMKRSVQLGLSFIEETLSPQMSDCWLLAPADLPSLTPDVIDHLLAAYDPDGPAVHVPSVEGRRAHPVLFPWKMAAAVHALADDEGVNRLLETTDDEMSIRELPWHDRGILEDIDTADDYQRLRGNGGE